MLFLDQMFDVQEPLSKTEEDIIAEALSNPVVVKYLKRLGKNDLIELATLSVAGESDSVVAKKHSVIQGRLSTLAALLSISTTRSRS